MDRLEENPFQPGPGRDIKRLPEGDETYRLRVGSYRVLYEVRRDSREIVVTRVAPRSQAYRP